MIAPAYSMTDRLSLPSPRPQNRRASGQLRTSQQRSRTKRLSHSVTARSASWWTSEGSALVDILGVNLSGQLGAYVWKVVYLYELGYALNRAHVLADWTIDLFTRPDTSKLFEDPNQPRVRT